MRLDWIDKLPSDVWDFKEVMSLFPVGVSVVTTIDPAGDAYGVTVGSVVSVSLDPRLVLFCLDNQISGLNRFQVGNPLMINFLAETQIEISQYFATPGTDRGWTCTFYRQNPPSGLPEVNETFALLKGQVTATYPGGDHTLLLVEITSARAGSLEQKGLGPLVYYRRTYRKLEGI
jgi:flavin reductase (DIM6/NTAB) family NADH-FMN oxidoreductase RutF